MTFAVEVLVTLKPGLPIRRARRSRARCPTLGWTNVSDVRVGKHIRSTVEAADEAAARAQVDEMATRLLSNPVIEDYRILESEEA